jgi:pyruvate ferredoxin oxidoreductase beta subunit
VVEGKLTLSYIPKEKKPVEDYLKEQGRFRHLFDKGNEHLIEEYQKQVDKEWQMLMNLHEMK